MELAVKGFLYALATHLPVWRELKRFPILACIPLILGLLHTFPFEGNWNHFLLFRCLSRLLNLLHTFPFEGNWNSSEKSGGNHLSFPLLHTFPFEGNGNPPYGFGVTPHKFQTCYTPSRLKRFVCRIAIARSFSLLYTFPFEGNGNVNTIKQRITYNLLATHVPVWREWKPDSRMWLRSPVPSCYTRSRLKGMETLPGRWPPWILPSCLLHTFPLEGNGNTSISFPDSQPPLLILIKALCL